MSDWLACSADGLETMPTRTTVLCPSGETSLRPDVAIAREQTPGLRHDACETARVSESETDAVPNPDGYLVDKHDSGLTDRILLARDSGDVVRTTLNTDKRVLARVTDGIYRQPGSALRELISNAYDADATRVTIQTDRPRFRTITIRDDGRGMDPKTLAHMIRHIGGSAKRSESGADLGVTLDGNSALSPGGRRLIGRIGIGLFSVSQLTQHFQIVTKRAGDAWRSVAAVQLGSYSEPGEIEESEQITTGLVQIWQQRATDINSSGTTITLDAIRPAALKTLQSSPEWQRLARKEKLAMAPRYHVGEYAPKDDALKKHGGSYDSLPWDQGGEPRENFALLVEAVWNELYLGNRNPRLDRLFDHYLQMVWGLSLSIPTRYVGGHPFDINLQTTAAYHLPGSQPGPAIELALTEQNTIRKRLNLPPAGLEGSDNFEVQIDDLTLERPQKFVDLPNTSHAIKHPLLFAGGLREEFSGLERELSGGPLAFQAYFLWTPKIAPVEHNGVLIRLHGASGTLFDPNFMNFKLAELTRLRQITCEVFVTEGLEGALNIDRESLNDTHPHTVRLTAWLHTALARAINQQKSIASRLHREARQSRGAEQLTELDAIVRELWDEQGWDGEPPETLGWRSSPGAAKGDVNSIRLQRSNIVGASASISRSSQSAESRLLTIARVLEAFELLDDLETEEAETLFRYLFRVLRTD